MRLRFIIGAAVAVLAACGAPRPMPNSAAKTSGATLDGAARSARTLQEWQAVLESALHDATPDRYTAFELALADPNADVRILALEKLPALRAHPRTLAVLRRGLADPIVKVRLCAVAAAVGLNHPEAAMTLHRRRRQEQDPRVREAIDKALAAPAP